jgi:hypothetical protein
MSGRPHIWEADLRLLLVACVLLSVVGACTRESAPQLVTYGGAAGTETLGMSGTLVEQDGCVMLQSDTDDSVITMLLSPEGFTLSDGAVLSSDGERVAEIGSRVELGGSPAAGKEVPQSRTFRSHVAAGATC